MTAFFELDWPCDYAGRGREWFAVGRDADGSWYFDAWLLRRVTIGGGAAHVARFAEFLLAAPPDGRYETGFFHLLAGDRPDPGFWDPAMLLSVDVFLGREQAGEAEYLMLWPYGTFPGWSAVVPICDELGWETVDRDRLTAQAARLLSALR